MTNRSAHTASPRHWLFWLIGFAAFFLFIYLIRSILLPFVLGMATAYFLDPAADRLERLKLSRAQATGVITGCFFTGIVLLTLLIAPVIAEQCAGLISALPGYAARFEQEYAQRVANWSGMLSAEHVGAAKNALLGFVESIFKAGGEFATGILLSGMAVLNLLSLFLITPVVAFYLLRDWDHIVEKLDALLPRRHADTIREQLSAIDRALAGFVRGQSMVCLLMGAYYAVALSLAGLHSAIVIGVISGALLILPYVGFAAACALAVGIAFFQFDTLLPVAAVGAIYLGGQAIESFFATPMLVGDRVGLHPVWIIFGMLAGAALLGFVGVLIAIPATAVIGVLTRFAVARYLESAYYR